MSFLLIPMRLDALCLSAPYAVMESMADFSRLPYHDGQCVKNASTPAVSDAILSDPLGQPSLVLQPGIHLHWALPDTFTRGTHKGDKVVFPPVPNRWLLTRRLDGKVQARWVVESDYLHPEGARPPDTVTIPFVPGPGEHQPFRHLGRRMLLTDWQNDADHHAYLPVLSAMGPYDELPSLDYVKATFAALYPSARSSFGLFDDTFADGIVPAGLMYEVIGWYSDAAQDPLAAWFAEQGDKDPASLIEAMNADLQWTCEPGNGAFPQRSICYARLTFAAGGARSQPDPRKLPLPDLSIGNTSAEALSAYLASSIDITHKGILEDQLEALEIEPRLSQQTLDVGPKFKESRHTRGFHAQHGGELYAIHPKGGTPGAQPKGSSLSSLPIELVSDLSDLNRATETLMRTRNEVLFRRQQVFADWCKYQLSTYRDARYNSWPKGSAILDFIEKRDLPALVAVTQEFATQQQAVKDKARALGDKLAAYNQQKGTDLELTSTMAPPYYRSNDPVVMMLGQAAAPTLRHGQDGHSRPDGLLQCELLDGELDLESLSNETLTALDAAIARIDPASSEGLSTWSGQPWNPLLLGWKVEVFPDPKSDSPAPDPLLPYDADLLAKHYELPENSPDLAPRLALGLSLPTSVYRGFSALTGQAHSDVKGRIADYLERALASDVSAPGFDLDRDIAKLKQSYANDKGLASSVQRAQDPVYTALCAYEQLLSLSCSSQMLGGLNDALLTMHQALQLPVADPRADARVQAISQAISQAVGAGFGLSPYPNNFYPLRAGAMDILNLRLIDTFGQVLDLRDLHRLSSVTMTVSEPLRHPGGRHPIYLRPRLSQSSRLNFRWLSAADGERATTDHPAMTPVCGWLLPNNLDDTLMVYDNEGRGLGLIDRQATWQPMPGAPAIAVADIPNPYLQRVVRFVLNQGPTFIDPFLTALDNALEGIDPENFATHQALSLLIARPIAVVRASLDLEIFGLAAYDQGERAMEQAVKTGAHSDGGLSEMAFPIRIGEYQQFNDGLLGYWPEDDEGKLAGKEFYAPQSDMAAHPAIRTHADGFVGMTQTIRARPQTMTLLVDPRARLHATCGVLPTTFVEIHPEHYARALQTIEAVFSTSPLLMQQGKVELSLPSEPGFSWAWLTKQGDTWSETTALSPMETSAAFAGPQNLVGGWLTLRRRAEEPKGGQGEAGGQKGPEKVPELPAHGEIVGNPAITSWGEGRLDVLARGTDNNLHHTWFDGVWHPWHKVGGPITSPPAAACWGPGRIDVVARGEDNRLYHWWFAGSWCGPDVLGDKIGDGAPAIASWGTYRLDIVVRGEDNQLWHKCFNGGWSGWESQGGKLSSGVAAVSWGPGRIDVFARDESGQLVHKCFDGAWGDFAGLGAPSSGLSTEAPAVGSWGAQELGVYVQSPNGELYARRYLDGWHPDFEKLRDGIASGPGAVHPASEKRHLVVRRPDGGLGHLYYENGAWHDDDWNADCGFPGDEG